MLPESPVLLRARKNFHPQSSPVLAWMIKNPRETVFLDRGLVKGVPGSQTIWGGEYWTGECIGTEYPNSVNESLYISGLLLSYTRTG